MMPDGQVRPARRWGRRVALAGLVASLVPLTLWAVPASHPRPVVRIRWLDRGVYIDQRVILSGLDRDGFVHQERNQSWEAGNPAALTDLRLAHAADPARLARLPPAEAWRPQWVDYGNNHVWLPHGVQLIDAGLTRTLPYTWVAAAMLMPAALWGLNATWRRAVSRRNRAPLPWAASSTGGGPTGTGPGRPG